ncbi:MAG TPA: hypothetical protein VMY42_22450 [Thermoguttaceae bacterium]|nr:hypothetical protein [Thermoguttaceae bacterium]
MSRPTRKLWILAAVAMAALLSGASEASAWWGYYQPAYLGGCGYGPCYSPSYCTSCYTPSYTARYVPSCTVGCDPCGDGCGWYLGYRPGPIRQLLFGPYRSYYGGGCSWSSCYDPCCTSTATIGTAMPTPAIREGTPTRALRQQPKVLSPDIPDLPAIPSTPATPLAPPVRPLTPDFTPPGLPLDDPAMPMPFDLPFAPTPAEPPTPAIPTTPAVPIPPTITPSPPFGGSAPAVQDGSALLTMTVPLGTEVYINDKPTKSTAMERQYISKGLDPNLVYKYKVVAYVLCERTDAGPNVVDWKKIPLEREVYLRAGDHQHLAFSANVATFYETEMVPVLDPSVNPDTGMPERDPATNQVIMRPRMGINPRTGEPEQVTQEELTGRSRISVIDDDLKEIYERLTAMKLDKASRGQEALSDRPAQWRGQWLESPGQAGI